MALKVLTIVGTRPEIVKLSRVINQLNTHTAHVLVHTGQNYDYELNEIFFQQHASHRQTRHGEVNPPRAHGTQRHPDWGRSRRP